MSDKVRAALASVVEGKRLSMDEARAAMGSVMDGEATPAQLAAPLAWPIRRASLWPPAAYFFSAQTMMALPRWKKRSSSRREISQKTG